QFIMICVPLVIGNLLVSRDSVRYLIPSLITMFGLAAILAVRAVATAGARSRRWLAAGWLGAVPVAALFAMPGARPPQPVHYVWPDVAELARLGDELARRYVVLSRRGDPAAVLRRRRSRGARCEGGARDAASSGRTVPARLDLRGGGVPDRRRGHAVAGPADRRRRRSAVPDGDRGHASSDDTQRGGRRGRCRGSNRRAGHGDLRTVHGAAEGQLR